MRKQNIFYKLYTKHGLEGYYIPVRNSFNNAIEREFIPLEAKDLYEKQFGDKVISDTEFLDWYTENAQKFS